SAQTMLTPGIHGAYRAGVAQLESIEGVRKLAQGAVAGQPNAAQAALYVTDARCFLEAPQLESEVFGPAAIVVACRDLDEAIKIAERLEGQLTATLQIDGADHDAARCLLPVLERKAGRILANGFPTGVEVCHATVHGGPYPSTSNAMYTSVGASAIDRFLRPVCYQDLPDDLRPDALKDANPLGLRRLRDGVYV
ncbi:MAG: aldehyde dehydrogenase (NADP(+)), partial [Paucibacter sp.]|nr:aldehyde dehydrogenase (NADP(+)) [Roseateles sp.]